MDPQILRTVKGGVLETGSWAKSQGSYVALGKLRLAYRGKKMPGNRRKPARLVTPAYEDSGIFKNSVGTFSVELVPMFGENMRRDLVIKGYLDGAIAVDVVFPGRRKVQADPVREQLRSLLARSGATACYANAGLEVDAVRLPASVEGAWRPRFRRDDQGWETRRHQLYVARWMIKDPDGMSHFFGSPVVR